MTNTLLLLHSDSFPFFLTPPGGRGGGGDDPWTSRGNVTLPRSKLGPLTCRLKVQVKTESERHPRTLRPKINATLR